MNLNTAWKLFARSKAGNGVKAVTIATYRQRIDTFLTQHGETELDQITIDQVEAWARQQYQTTTRWDGHPCHPASRGKLSNATIHGRIRALKTFLTWCNQRGHASANPTADLRMPRYPRILHNKVMADHDLAKMLKVTRRRAKEGNPRDHAILTFIADTGCRVGELCNLKLTDLDLTNLTALVDGKSGPGYVAYTPATAAALQAWLTARPRLGHDYLFVGLWGAAKDKPITRNAVYLTMKRIAREAAVSGRFNPHSVRHLVGQSWADHGVNLGLIQQKLRHADMNSTAVYLNQNIKRVQAKTDELSLVR